MKRTKERLKGEIFRALKSKIIDLLRDESQRNDGGAGDNKEPHEKYFVEPEGDYFRGCELSATHFAANLESFPRWALFGAVPRT